MHPYPVKIPGDPGIVERIVALDQLKRILDATESGMGLSFHGAHPESVNVSVR